MKMGMVHEVLAPGVKNGRQAQLGSETLLPKEQERGTGAIQKQSVESSGILQGQETQLRRKREDPVKVAHRQKSAALLLQPSEAALVLTARAVPVAATVGPLDLGQALGAHVEVA